MSTSPARRGRRGLPGQLGATDTGRASRRAWSDEDADAGPACSSPPWTCTQGVCHRGRQDDPPEPTAADRHRRPASQAPRRPRRKLAPGSTLLPGAAVVSTTSPPATISPPSDRISLGWVLIDEAARPCRSTGRALWRARRAVIVGDPLQLEPILQVRVPEDRLGVFGCGSPLATRSTSAQEWPTTATDGNEIPVKPETGHREDCRWSRLPGTPPLRRPMSNHNTIAYQGLHGLQTPSQPFPEARIATPRSSSVDVDWPRRRQWVTARATPACVLRRRRHGYNLSLDRIYVLTRSTTWSADASG